jgi:Flp pilus assembly protein TadD
LLRNAADRATRLAPDSDSAKFALALKYRRMPGNDDEALKLLRDLAARRPTDRMVLKQLGRLLEIKGAREEALAVYGRITSLPGDDAAARVNRAVTLKALGRTDDALVELGRAIELRPDFTLAQVHRLTHWFYEMGDVEAVKTALQQLPSRVMNDERMASLAAFLWYWLRDTERADAALRQVTRDYVESNIVTMPKALLTGMIHRAAGRKEAAAMEWRTALRVVEQRLSANPNSANDIGDKATLQALIGDPAAAATLRLYEEMMRFPVGRAKPQTWRIYAELGREDVALDFLAEQLSPQKIQGSGFPALLRVEPCLDRFRDQPRFKELAATVDRYFAAKQVKK